MLKNHSIEIKKNWHLIFIEIFGGYWTRKPMLDIRKNSFDFLWLGFQITYRYYGSGTVSGTKIRVKDYDKYIAKLGIDKRLSMPLSRENEQTWGET